jgi:hypothetical protein
MIQLTVRPGRGTTQCHTELPQPAQHSRLEARLPIRRHAVGGGFALAKGAERPFPASSGSALSAKASGWADVFA